MFDAILNALKAAVDWFLGLFTALASGLWAMFVALFPDTAKPTLDIVSNLIGFANAWLPMAEAFAMITIWVTIFLTFTAWRFVKQFIPTMSN